MNVLIWTFLLGGVAVAFDLHSFLHQKRSTHRTVAPIRRRTGTRSTFGISSLFSSSTRIRTTTEFKSTTPSRLTTESTTFTTTSTSTTAATSTSTVDPALLPDWLAEQKANSFLTTSDGQRAALAKLSDEGRFLQTLLPIAVPRVAGTLQSLEVQNFIVSKLNELNYTIELDEFEASPPAGHTPYNMTNVIATLDPAAPRRLVLACHYDSKFDSAGEFIGLSDSAAPCAMMIDLAEALHPFLSNRSSNLNVTLQLMFLDGEEAIEKWSSVDSLYGARHLADEMQQTKNEFAHENASLSQLNSIDFMVLLDLIGTIDTSLRPFYYTAKGQFARLVKIEEDLTNKKRVKKWGKTASYFDDTPLPPHVWVDDDYRPFIEKGVKILHLVSYPFPSVWHKHSDNLANMHYETIDDLLIILRVYLCEYLNCQI